MTDNAGKGVTDLLGIGQVGAKAVEVTGYFLDKVIGPSLENIGEGLAAPLVVWKEQRIARARDVVNGAVQHVLDAGRDPQPVPGRILVPLLTSAALEDDAAMLEVWTRLLANAGDPACRECVLPSFVTLLADLSPREAVLLNAIYQNRKPDAPKIDITVIDRSGKHRPFLVYPPEVDPHFRRRAVAERLEYEVEDFRIFGGNLARMGLAWFVPHGKNAGGTDLSRPPSQYALHLTPLGHAFVEACRRS